MLILSRHRGERVVLRDADGKVIATVTVVDIRGDKLRLGIDAPKEIAVRRQEVDDAIQNTRAFAESLVGSH